MKRGLLNKIVRPHVSVWRMIVANAGTALGLAGLLLAVQLYFDFGVIFEGGGATGSDSDYLIISKTVNFRNTVTFTTPTFSEDEIEMIRSQPFVQRLGEIKGSTFGVIAVPSDFLNIYTQFFLESVPADMLDEVPPGWEWAEGDTELPIILSAEFFNIYNLVFAPSQGLPPFTTEALKLASLPITIKSGTKSHTIRGRVRGLSHRIPSVMVPEEFLKWANENYGTDTDPAPCRVLIEVADAADPAIMTFLRENEFETNRDRLRRSRTAGAARIAVVVTGAISLLIAGLSVMLAAMNAQLLISRSAAALALLVQLGYERGVLARWLMVTHAAFLGGVAALAVAVFGFGTDRIRTLFVDNGFEPPSTIEPLAWVVLVGFSCVTLLLQIWAVRGGLERVGLENGNT